MSTRDPYLSDESDDHGKPTIDLDIDSPAFRSAELKGEHVRVVTLMGILGSLLLLVLVRAITAIAQGRRSEVWALALVLALAIGYEAVWLVYIRGAIRTRQKVSRTWWRNSVILESLLPTAALFLQIPFMGPGRALTSPVLFAYFFFILLSTLHLDPRLSRLAGVGSAAGYTMAAAKAFREFPDAVPAELELAYAVSFSCVICLLLGGFVAGTIAGQIRHHMAAALHDAENRAKSAQMEHDLEIARSIHQGFLPETFPPTDGFDVAAWNQPAGEIGWDYFDWQRLGDGRLAVTVADVAGYGIGAALCMASCRAYARATLAAEPELRSALGRVNRLLYADLPPERFVTLAVGLLDPDEATMELISAGHGPLLFYLSAEKRFRSYDAQGVPLGLLPDPNYLPHQLLRFGPGDIFAFFTEGFIEWANPQGEEFGQKRLKEVIQVNSHRPAKAIIASLYAALVEFTGSTPQPDDLTVVILKRESV